MFRINPVQPYSTYLLLVYHFFYRRYNYIKPQNLRKMHNTRGWIWLIGRRGWCYRCQTTSLLCNPVLLAIRKSEPSQIYKIPPAKEVGQIFELQALSSIVRPRQPLPPLCASRCISLSLSWVPPPHETEHSDQALNCDHWQSARITFKIMNFMLLRVMCLMSRLMTLMSHE